MLGKARRAARAGRGGGGGCVTPSRPLRSCPCGVPLSFPIARPLFCWFLDRRDGGQVRWRRETPPGLGNPRNGAGRVIPGPLQARAALAACGGRPAPERQVASVVVVARRYHAEPRVSKLVGCSRVTRGSSPGARSCGKFDLQIDFPLKGSEHFRCFSGLLLSSEFLIPCSKMTRLRGALAAEERCPPGLCVLS
ncbi:hypothetical protein NN561_014257 [Cricetulus griseus]